MGQDDGLDFWFWPSMTSDYAFLVKAFDLVLPRKRVEDKTYLQSKRERERDKLLNLSHSLTF